jgi:hypothetical protein
MSKNSRMTRKNIYFSKHLFSSWKPPENPSDSETTQKRVGFPLDPASASHFGAGEDVNSSGGSVSEAKTFLLLKGLHSSRMP